MPGSRFTAQPGFTLTQMVEGLGNKCNFGAIATGLDLDNIKNHDVAALSNAICEHKLVAVKAQKHIHPDKQWYLVTKLDPDAPEVQSDGDVKRFNAIEVVFGIPGVENVRIVGKGSQEDEPEVVDDLIKIRDWLQPIQERVLKPELIIVSELDQGDVVMWANYQLFHSAIDYPSSIGSRTMHQVNIGASTGPINPFPISVLV